MIRITKFDSEFKIFENKKVIIWGCSSNGIQALNLLKYFKIDVFSFCDNNPDFHGGGVSIHGIKVISPAELENLKNQNNIIIQLALNTDKSNDEVKEQIKSIGNIEFIETQELNSVLGFVRKMDFLYKNPEFLTSECHSSCSKDVESEMYSLIQQNRMRDFMLNFQDSQILITTSCQKTGDTTLKSTFSKNRIPHFNTEHNTHLIEKNILNSIKSKIKVITVLREPISQNLSTMYQLLVTPLLSVKSRSMRSLCIEEILGLTYENFFENGGDAQDIFNNMIDYSDYMKPIKTKKYSNSDCYSHIIQHFVPEFQKNVFDIMKEPFDKEKGFKILKDDKMEVFVCQLEKLNDVAEELAKFSGGTFKELVMANEASSKWISESYENFKKDVRFSEEYFNKCFSEPYVNHFYSDEQIEKFKKKWINNVDFKN